jgi:SAM-dependent methyltransferase
MSFLSWPIFWAGMAAAVLGPLLISLLNRRRVKTVEFSSVMFLRDLRKTRMRRLQLRRWLLLIIRTLIVAVAAMAFARPTLKSGVFAELGSRAHTTAVIAIDRSASMALETANGSTYERAQLRAGTIFDLLGEGDDVIGLPFAGPAAPVAETPTSDFDRVRAQLKDLPVSSAGTDAGQALAEALTALRSGDNLNREIYLISDLRREGFVNTVLPPANLDDAAATVYIIDVSEEGAFDFGIDEVRVGDQMIEVGSPFTMSAVIANFTDRPADRLLVSLFVDGRRVSQTETALPAGGSATVSFTATVESAGTHTGFVEISADDNPLNNRRFFALAIPDEVHVLLASDYPSGRRAARLALSPRPQTEGRLKITEIDTDALLGENFFDYDCVIITEWRRPGQAVVDHLLRYVRSGGGVFAAPSIDADTTAWNDLIAVPHFGLHLGPNPNPPDPERYFVWDRLDWDHPIWSVYKDVRRDRIPEVRWYSIYRTTGEPLGHSLADFSGGRQSVSETRLDAGKLIVSWAPPNAPYTDLPLRSSFVPFMHRLAEYLAADLTERRGDFLVGEPILREPAAAVGSGADVQLITPDQIVERPNVEWAGRRIKVRVGPRELPGVYTIADGDHPIDVFAVNIDPAENRPEKIDRGELERRWGGYNLVFVSPEELLEGVVNQTRYGTEVRRAFLWAVMALILLEMFVAGSRRREIPDIGIPVKAPRGQLSPAD